MITKTATGFATKAEAQTRLDELEANFGAGYGFYPRPITEAQDGTFQFIWSTGDSCD